MPAAKDGLARPVPAHRTPTILIVDDNSIDRQAIASSLTRSGFRALQAGNGPQALQSVRSERPDVVISDILMPGMDGYEFVQHLRSDPPVANTPVIFCSGTYNEPDARSLAKACGVSVVLPKPCEPRDILEAVSRVLGVEHATWPVSPVTPARSRTLPRVHSKFFEYALELHGVAAGLSELSGRVHRDEQCRRDLHRFAARLTGSTADLERLGNRMHALVELDLNAGVSRDPDAALRNLFETGRRLIPADFAALGLSSPTDPPQRRALAHGVSTDWYTTIPASQELPRVLAKVIETGRSVQRTADGSLPSADLPPGHPPVGSVLGVPLASRYGSSGWMYFANRPGKSGFSDEDEKVAATLGSIGITHYEGARLYDLVQHHAAQLQLEVTRRERAEAAVSRLNRVHAMLSGINALIVRERSRAALFQEACRIAVEQGGFRLAWIALLQGDEAVPVAFYGGDPQLAQDLRFSLRPDSPNANGPTERALRSGMACVASNIGADEALPAHLQTAARLGIQSFLAQPLIVKGQVVGALALYATEPDFFDEPELKLLADLAGEIAYAMEFILREEQFDYLAIYDPLTRLPNRTLFLRRLEGFMQSANEATTRFAVLMLDVERFKALNDALGRATGDEVLTRIGDRIKYLAGGPSFAARVGGDRFAVVIPDIAVNADADARVLTRDWLHLGDPIPVGGQEIAVSLRVGMALFPEDAEDAEGLLRNSELALKHGRSRSQRYTRYARSMEKAAAEKLTLEWQLRRALKRGQFVLHYHPKLDLKTGCICGVEALIRWNDPDRGLIPPGTLIPLLEETGLIVDVGGWALKQAADDHSRWMRDGLIAPRVAVNVSLMQLMQPTFVGDVLAICAGAAAGYAGFELEITESMLMTDTEPSIAKLRHLRDAGVAIVMDDFGTGYSSLAALARLPLDAIKIDRSFVAGMSERARMAIVSAVVSMARAMSLKVIAEGVEAPEQLRLLQSLGCDQMQGFLFSRPVPGWEFAELLRSGRTLPKVF